MNNSWDQKVKVSSICAGGFIKYNKTRIEVNQNNKTNIARLTILYYKMAFSEQFSYDF